MTTKHLKKNLQSFASENQFVAIAIAIGTLATVGILSILARRAAERRRLEEAAASQANVEEEFLYDPPKRQLPVMDW